jgi:hypothetical protein
MGFSYWLELAVLGASSHAVRLLRVRPQITINTWRQVQPDRYVHANSAVRDCNKSTSHYGNMSPSRRGK